MRYEIPQTATQALIQVVVEGGCPHAQADATPQDIIAEQTQPTCTKSCRMFQYAGDHALSWRVLHQAVLQKPSHPANLVNVYVVLFQSFLCR